MCVRIKLESAVSCVASRCRIAARIDRTACPPVLWESSGLNSIIRRHIVSVASLVIERHREGRFTRRRRETLPGLEQSRDIVTTRDSALFHFLSGRVGDNLSCANEMRLVIAIVAIWIHTRIGMSIKINATNCLARGIGITRCRLVEPVRTYVLDLKGSDKHALAVIEGIEVLDPVFDTGTAAVCKDWGRMRDGGKYQSICVYCGSLDYIRVVSAASVIRENVLHKLPAMSSCSYRISTLVERSREASS